MGSITLNLATHLRGLLRFTDDKDEDRQVDFDISIDGFDPVDSATLHVAPAEGKSDWLTCHVLFPEIVLDEIPKSLQLDAEILEGKPNLTIDAADPNGPCIAMPLVREGTHLGDNGQIDVDGHEFMVWKESRKRELQAPLRLKYLLIFSPSGEGFTVKIKGLRIDM